MLIHSILCFILKSLLDWMTLERSILSVEILWNSNRTLVRSSHETVSAISYRFKISPQSLLHVSHQSPPFYWLPNTGSEKLKVDPPEYLSRWHNLRPVLDIQTAVFVFLCSSIHDTKMPLITQFREAIIGMEHSIISRTIPGLMSDHLQRTVCQRLIKISWEPLLNDVLSWEIQSHLILKSVLNSN